LTPMEFAQQATAFLDRDLPSSIKRPLDTDYVHQITPLLQERAKTLGEIAQLADFFFLDELQYNASLLLAKGINAKSAADSVQTAIQKLGSIKTWDDISLEDALRPLAVELNLSTGNFFGLLRVAITGRTAAPPLFHTMAVLGREKCLNRLAAAWQRLSTD